jgi:uncharacterized protein YydD (DUF2326 family)
MIHSIYSETLGTFKRLDFHKGLNLLVAEKSPTGGGGQSRNKSGKSSLILLIHFLLGARVDASSIFSCPELASHQFVIELDLGPYRVKAWRQGSDPSWVNVSGPTAVFEPIHDQERQRLLPRNEMRLRLTNEQWKGLLSHHLFGFDYEENENEGTDLRARSVLPYFARVVSSMGQSHPHKHSSSQPDGEAQVVSAWLLGLDSPTLHHWQEWRQRSHALRGLKKASSLKILDDFNVGDRRELVREKAMLQKRIERTRTGIMEYRIEESFQAMNGDVSSLTETINDLIIQINEDERYLSSIVTALRAEAPPPLHDLVAVYKEANFIVPDVITQTFDAVKTFHESVLKNRRYNLANERTLVEGRLSRRKLEIKSAEDRRAALLKTMERAGTLMGFAKLQTRLASDEQRVEAIQRKLDLDERIRNEEGILRQSRRELESQLETELKEQKSQIEAASESISARMKSLYNQRVVLTIEATKSGLKPTLHVHGRRATSVRGLLTVCWDLYIMESLSRRGTGPGFLIHDSELFDSADRDQRASVLKMGEEASRQWGFQYIVTVNSDQLENTIWATPEARERNWLRVSLTGSEGGGGLFGILFD